MKRTLRFSLFLVLFFFTSFSLAFAKGEILLHFVQVSDTHVQVPFAKDNGRLLGSSEKLLNEVVSKVNNIKDLDFVLFTGDEVDTCEGKLVDKFIDITKGLKYPYYVLFGNHDVSVNGGLGKKGFIKKFTSIEGQKSFSGGMNYYSFLPNEKFKIICLDGTTDKVVTAHGQFDENQLSFLKSELEDSLNKKQFVIIAQHFPAIEPFKSKSHNILEPDLTNFLNIINSYKNVIGVFTGHYHSTRLQKLKNKIHNSNPAVVQYPNAFREIIISKENNNYLNVEFKWHEVGDPSLREISKNGTANWKMVAGNDDDKKQIIKFKIYE